MVQTTLRPADERMTTGLSDLDPEASAIRTPGNLRPGRARFGNGGNRGPNRRLDGLTAVAVVVLMAQGLGLPVTGGHLAVDVLLVCLGFRFARAVRNDADQQRRTRRFWFHQLGPILAPVLLYVIIVAVFWAYRGGLGLSQLAAVLGAATMTLNVFMVGSDAGFSALEHLWVVAIIVQLGVLTPLLVLGGRRVLSAQRRALALCGVVALVWVGRLALLVTGGGTAADLAMGTTTRMDGFLLGLAIGVAPLPTLRRRLPIALAPLAFAIMLLLFVAAPDTASTPWYTLGIMVPMVEVLAALVMAWTATGGAAGALDRTLDNKFASWVGQRAISIYVWHQYFALVIVADGGTAATDSTAVSDAAQWPGVGVFATRLAFSLAAAVVSHRFLVIPAMAAAADFLARTRSTPSAATAPRRGARSRTTVADHHPSRFSDRSTPIPDHEHIEWPHESVGEQPGEPVPAEQIFDLPAGVGMEAIKTIDLSLPVAEQGPQVPGWPTGQLSLVPFEPTRTTDTGQANDTDRTSNPNATDDAFQENVADGPDGAERPTPLFTRSAADRLRPSSAAAAAADDDDLEQAPVRRVPRPVIDSAPLIDHLRKPAKPAAEERPVRIQLRTQPARPTAAANRGGSPPPSLLRT